MEQKGKLRELLLAQYKRYPKLQIRDIFKYIYQSVFGCEHMATSFETAVDYILSESSQSTSKPNQAPLIDRLDNAYSRVDLAYLNCGLSPKTLAKLFLLSSKCEKGGIKDLEALIETAKELAVENLFDFSLKEFEAAAKKWQADGYPPVHHSDTFKALYNPSYRVIANKYVAFLPLFAKIDGLLNSGEALVAIEGGAASGKTTLSEILKEVYGCTVFHMDDFFLRPEQRTPERYNEAGGNIDRERFLEEVLIPLKTKKTVNYRKFDCADMTLTAAEKISPKKLTVIEGAYSMHPDLAKYYNLSVFLDISPALQTRRLKKRNSPQTVKRFLEEWIPLEQLYFSKLDIKNHCDLSFLADDSL